MRHKKIKLVTQDLRVSKRENQDLNLSPSGSSFLDQQSIFVFLEFDSVLPPDFLVQKTFP